MFVSLLSVEKKNIIYAKLYFQLKQQAFIKRTRNKVRLEIYYKIPRPIVS